MATSSISTRTSKASKNTRDSLEGINSAIADPKARGNWSGQLDFLLSAIGFSVGLGNVWRFPYRAYANGGGSFLLPYGIMLFCAGLPLFFMELSLGQFSSLGPIAMWNIAPAARGVGLAMVVVSALVCIYYNMIIAYAFFYLFASFTSKLPWSSCKSSWLEKYKCTDSEHPAAADKTYKYCVFMHSSNITNATSSPDYVNNCVQTNSSLETHCSVWLKDYFNHTEIDTNFTSQCFTPFDWCKSIRKMPGLDENQLPVYTENCEGFRTPSDIYWENEVLDVSGSIEVGHGEFVWPLVLCLLLAWILIFLCLYKGIKSSGKVVYFTATFPYIVLIILLVRNVTLTGAQQGIKFYITPDWNRLKDEQVWYNAAIQVFYSMGIAFGSLGTMASYNKFHNNVHRDSWIVTLLDCVTSIFAGFVIFSVIGYMAESTGQDISKVANYGPGLAFVAYPAGISAMPVAPLWSILFFLMLLTLGVDSQFAMMETVITAISDVFPVLRTGRNKAIFTLVVCVAFFLIGLPQCARNGVYIMNLFDWYSAGFSLLIIAIIECLTISYVYGVFRFKNDLHMMLGTTSCKGRTFTAFFWTYWLHSWTFICPALLIFTLIMYGKNYSAVMYGTQPYPVWADGVGWFMVAIAIVWIPVVAVYELVRPFCHEYGSCWVLKQWLHPRPNWGPALPEHRTNRYEGTSTDTLYDIPPTGIDCDKKPSTADQSISTNHWFDNKINNTSNEQNVYHQHNGFKQTRTDGKSGLIYYNGTFQYEESAQ